MAKITLGSKLSFKEINRFVDQVSSLLNSDEKLICVDMASCQYLNSLMLSGLIRAQKMCDQAQRKMVLQKVSASTMTLFQTTNVLSLFTIEGGEDKNALEEKLELSFKKNSEEIGTFILRGILNTAEHCSVLRDLYEDHINDINHAILDCQNLFHLGSQGVTELFRLRGLFEEKSGKVLIVSQTDSVESVWRMMHLESLIPKIDSLKKAEEILNS